MKKVWVFLVLCGMLLSLTACDTARFKSEAELMSYLEGVWVDDSSADGCTYYIFRDGKLFVTSDGEYRMAAEDVLLRIMKQKGFAAMGQVTYTDVAKSAEVQNLINNSKTIKVEPEAGKITLRPGAEFESYIIVQKERVVFQKAGQESYTTLRKSGDRIDYYANYFRDIFNEKREEMKIPKEELLMSVADYERYLNKLHPEMTNWVLTEKSGDYTTYTTSGDLTRNSGSFIRGSDRLLLALGGVWPGVTSPFHLVYTTNKITILERKYGVKLEELLIYAEPLLEKFPGALTTDELSTLFAEKHTKDGQRMYLETTVNSVTYKIDYNDYTGDYDIQISFPDTMKMTDAVAYAGGSDPQ